MLDSLLQDIGITISVHAYIIMDKKRWNEPKISTRTYRSRHFMLLKINTCPTTNEKTTVNYCKPASPNHLSHEDHHPVQNT